MAEAPSDIAALLLKLDEALRLAAEAQKAVADNEARLAQSQEFL